MQYTTGINNEIDYLITKNKKDYIDDDRFVLTPTEWMEVSS